MLAQDIQLAQIRAADEEADLGVLRSAAADACHLGHRRPGILRHDRKDVGPDRIHDDELVALTLLDRLQAHVDRREVPRAGLVSADRDQRVVHLGHLLPHRRCDTVRQDL